MISAQDEIFKNDSRKLDGATIETDPFIMTDDNTDHKRKMKKVFKN